MGVEVNWLDYFESIKTVCPWSWAAIKKDNIDIIHWDNTVKELDQYEARVYIALNYKARHLKKITKKLNQIRTTEEWLWSHPKYLYNSTPVPVLIQQDLLRLTQIRQQITKKGNVKY